MHIAGVLVQARPEQLSQLQLRLGSVPGIEIHHINPDGRLVITVEGDGRKVVADALFAVHSLDGVLSASLVYEESDEESDFELEPVGAS